MATGKTRFSDALLCCAACARSVCRSVCESHREREREKECPSLHCTLNWRRLISLSPVRKISTRISTAHKSGGRLCWLAMNGARTHTQQWSIGETNTERKRVVEVVRPAPFGALCVHCCRYCCLRLLPKLPIIETLVTAVAVPQWQHNGRRQYQSLKVKTDKSAVLGWCRQCSATTPKEMAVEVVVVKHWNGRTESALYCCRNKQEPRREQFHR